MNKIGLILIGFSLGFFITDWAWKIRIKEKALSGFRLVVWGTLYEVKESDWTENFGARWRRR